MRPFLTCFGIGSKDERIDKVATHAARQGYAVVPLRPSQKVPDLCTLTEREQKAVGGHECGVKHAITDPALAGRVFERLGRKFDLPLNLGVVAWPSRLIVIDADHEASRHAFLADWAAAEQDEGYLSHSPTVRTPGARTDDGVWQHKDGGHWYFSVPEGVELELGRQVIKTAGDYDVRWGWSMTVVPPSTRREGPYVPTGDVLDAPAFLLRLIAEDTGRLHEKRSMRGSMIANDAIARWSSAVDWSDLLIGDGWTATSKVDSCGCRIFEKPGGGSTTSKSATGHDPICARYENVEGHGPLHLWTTDPPPPLDEWLRQQGPTLTKLQYVALTRYEGDIELAKVRENITPATLDWINSMPISPRPTPPRSEGHGDMPVVAVDNPETDAQDSPDLIAVQQELNVENSQDLIGVRQESNAEDLVGPGFFRPDESETFRQQVVVQARADQVRARATELRQFMRVGPSQRMRVKKATEIVPTSIQPEIAHRNDGVALLYRGRVNTIWGPSDSGKSWFSLACALDVVHGGGRALIIDTEDDENGLWHRLDLLGGVPEGIEYVRLWAMPDSLEADELLACARVSDLVIIDSLDGFLALYLMDSNSATAVRTAGALMKLWAQAGNAAVLVVDHETEKRPGQRSHTALGSSAKKQLIDGIMLRADRENRWEPMKVCRTMVMLGKDRHAWAKMHAEFDPQAADEEASWGRLARLELTPGLDGPSRLQLLAPPSYEAEPNRRSISHDDRVLIEERIVEFLAVKCGGDWQSKTEVLKAAGDKNARHGENIVLEDLVADGLVEHEEQAHPTVPGRKLQRYRIQAVKPQGPGG